MPELPENTIAPRELQHGQRCEVWIASVTGERELAFPNVDVLLEAPNTSRVQVPPTVDMGLRAVRC